MSARAVLAAALLGAPLALHAQQAVAPPAPVPHAAAPELPGFGQLALGLGAVLVLIVVLGWLARRLPMLGPGRGPLRVAGSLVVGSRERIVLVEVDGERVLVGVAPGMVTRLHVLEGERRAPAPAQWPTPGEFGAALDGLRGQRPGNRG
ncbi:flagellar protein FliO/FliZ [Plasticicumulans lactativorans]|uniref:Flagellar protein FliO/FliZ n=1 Tax=Plasticicumulans lactativorans TaxID=1133106 RepID=A0A4R2LJW9_9GAMM|nr:flagellar biosynthetic protein FliO [Plasticicumulans lactativorans]TCO79675.1 flagellar protein FliO/FliZ [Plasticicumulans lactativorans]